MIHTFTIAGKSYQIAILRLRPELVLSIDGRMHHIALPTPKKCGEAEITLNGETTAFSHAQHEAGSTIRLNGQTFEVGYIDPLSAAQAVGGSNDVILAPMPGIVISHHRAVGDTVQVGDKVLTIESMKLETALLASREGIIAEMSHQVGDQFNKDHILVRFEPMDEEN